jgi:arginine/ornithine succinyltransferase subunit-like protein
MDFNHVDGLTAIGKKSFIAELMPRQPLYVDYLPESTRAVIGQVHRSTLPARKLLEQEGMHYEGYVDIFDAGPVLQGRVAELRAVRDSVLTVAEEGHRKASANHCWSRTRSSTISAWSLPRMRRRPQGGAIVRELRCCIARRATRCARCHST